MTDELADLDILKDNLQHHVAQLGGEIGERNVRSALRTCAEPSIATRMD